MLSASTEIVVSTFCFGSPVNLLTLPEPLVKSNSHLLSSGKCGGGDGVERVRGWMGVNRMQR